jgi:GAF domain-containing protein
VSTEEDFFASLAADLQSEPDLRVTVQRAVGYVRALTRCDEVSVRLDHVTGDGTPFVAATSARGERLDALRDRHASPRPTLPAGVDAAPDDGGAVLVDDTARDPRWPAWCAALAAEGVGTTLTVGLAARGVDLGVLTLSSATAGSLRRHVGDEPLGLLLRQVAVALADLRAAADLESVREARTVVGQAQGILMERFDLDADAAFSVLRRWSQQGNVKLREVAARLVETRQVPEQPRRARPRPAPGAAARAASSAGGTPASA